MASVRRDMD